MVSEGRESMAPGEPRPNGRYLAPRPGKTKSIGLVLPTMTLASHGVPLYSGTAAPRADDQRQPLTVAGSGASSTTTCRLGPTPAI